MNWKYFIVLTLFTISCKKPNIERNTLIGGCTDMDSPLYEATVDFEGMLLIDEVF